MAALNIIVKDESIRPLEVSTSNNTAATVNHTNLSNLAYETSGHTGFASKVMLDNIEKASIQKDTELKTLIDENLKTTNLKIDTIEKNIQSESKRLDGKIDENNTATTSLLQTIDQALATNNKKISQTDKKIETETARIESKMDSYINATDQHLDNIDQSLTLLDQGLGNNNKKILKIEQAINNMPSTGSGGLVQGYVGPSVPGPDDQYSDVEPGAKPWSAYQEVVSGNLIIEVPSIPENTLLSIISLDFIVNNPLGIDELTMTKNFFLIKDSEQPMAIIAPENFSYAGAYNHDTVDIAIMGNLIYNNPETEKGMLVLYGGASDPNSPDATVKLYVRLASILYFK